jgi:hypothetical protein
VAGAIGPPERAFPEIEVAENLLDDRVILNQRDQSHLAAAFRAEHGINIPRSLDEIAPSAGGDFTAFVGRPLRLPRIVHDFGRRQPGRLPYSVFF